MRVLIAPDKFKNSLTSQQVCGAVARGLKKSLPQAECISFPLADGGEGTSEILTLHSGGSTRIVSVHDPLRRTIQAHYGVSSDEKMAFIEMANASGLWLLADTERNVMETTTIGTGELIRDALESGVNQIILGIGGSATNDAGVGAASVLGYSFLDMRGKPVDPVSKNLVQICEIKNDKIHPALNDATFTAICDVNNPFYGERGAACVYAPQKGASPEQVRLLDEGLRHVSEVIYRCTGVDVRNIPGAGAGGGLGGGAVAFLNASLRKGIDVVFELTQFERQVRQADIIITGEGRMDEQTLYGKVVAGVASMAKKHHKNVIGVTDRNKLTPDQQRQLGLETVFALDTFADDRTLMSDAFHHMQTMVSTEVVARTIAELE